MDKSLREKIRELFWDVIKLNYHRVDHIDQATDKILVLIEEEKQNSFKYNFLKQAWKKELLFHIPDRSINHTSFCGCERCKVIDQVTKIVEEL